jgi:hypothetical protein
VGSWERIDEFVPSPRHLRAEAGDLKMVGGNRLAAFPGEKAGGKEAETKDSGRV